MNTIAARLRKIEEILAVGEAPQDFIIEIVGIVPGTMARSWGVRNIRENGEVRQEYLNAAGEVVDEQTWLAGVGHPAIVTDNRSSRYHSGGRR